MRTTKERGLYKEKIKQALFSSENISEILLGDTSELSSGNKAKLFNDFVKSHLFVDGTLDNEGTYIFFDVLTRSVSSQVKNCTIVMYVICHRDILDYYYKEGYYGNRTDILSQMIEDCLVCDEKVASSFGIGKITLDSVELYNSHDYYGCIMTFSAPDFR
ncbi:MAG: hypothetical protein J1E56_02755 [Ruminococcus sp.]|nr:hypothetical protein [Ruminococcus sp.]